jgi:hypothetical protein
VLDGHLLEVGDVETGLLALHEGVFGGFGSHVGLGGRLVAAAAAVGSMTLMAGHAGYPSEKGRLNSMVRVRVRRGSAGQTGGKTG